MSFSTRHHRARDTPDPNYSMDPRSQAQAPAAKPSLFSNAKEDVYAALLEYVGTTVFLLLAFGGVQASQNAGLSTPSSDIERNMYISTTFGLSLLVSAWLFYRVTGGLFNPDVSLALLLTGIIGPFRFVLYCIAQLVGGITAAAIVYALTPGPLASNTFLTQGVNRAQGVFIEMFITGALVLSILMLAAEKHNATPFAPVGIGLTLFVCHLWAVDFTGAGMNTARAFGPAVVTGFPYNSHWVYWLGPFLGSLLGSGFYTLLKHLKYWRFNPGQDTMDYRESPADPVHHVRSVVRNSISRRSRSQSRDGSQSNSATRNSGASGPHLAEKPVAPNERPSASAPRDATHDGTPEADHGRGLRVNDSVV